ncbi:hypothetical protein [Marinobacter shengliensis]|uniref:hypothetical protein n=1 Tax=Marinobacter shengliensis TaxID=1389223 RepID=UPI001109CEED|nr:hypothetical protein [Marinobacter shengliensis]
MPRSITVVYTINDEEAFKPELEKLGQSYQDYDPKNPPAWGVSAMSKDNEMLRLEKIEAAIENDHGDDAVDEVARILGEPRCQ